VNKQKRQLKGLPAAMVVVDVGREAIAVNEAAKLGIPVVGIVDSNCDPTKIDVVIPGNDDAFKSIGRITQVIADAFIEGREGRSQQEAEKKAVAAEKKGLYWLSSDMDQKSIAPDTVLAAQVYNFTNVVMEIVNDRAKGVLGGKHIELSLANGGLQFVFNDKIIGNVPAAAKQAVLDAKAKIIDGSVKVNIQ